VSPERAKKNREVNLVTSLDQYEIVDRIARQTDGTLWRSLKQVAKEIAAPVETRTPNLH
jgi:hypothetical protein